MIKGYKFLINEEEKSRILNLHQNRTRSQYLNISEQDDDIYDAWSYESPSGEDETISGEKETEIEKKDNTKISFGTDSAPKHPNQITNVQTQDETGDDKYEQKPTIQSLTPQDAAELELTKQKELSQTPNSQTKTEFVPPKTHSEGVSQITEKLKSLGYDTTNIGTAVLQFLEKNKPS